MTHEERLLYVQAEQWRGLPHPFSPEHARVIHDLIRTVTRLEKRLQRLEESYLAQGER